MSRTARPGSGHHQLRGPGHALARAKRMGRVSLRFFKISGAFDYDVVDRVAREALRALFKKRSLKISKLSKAKVFLNRLLPSVIDEKVRKVWRPEV